MEILEIIEKKIRVHKGNLEEDISSDTKDFPYKIINIVCLAKMGLDPEEKIDFDILEKKIKVKRLNRFPCVLFKIDGISMILFRNGKIIMTGIKEHKHIPILKEKIINHLKNNGNLDFPYLNIEIQNLVVMTQLGKLIDLEMSYLALTNCLYEPEQFPAAIVKPETGGTFLIFSNSKIIGLGMKSMEIVENSLKSLICNIFEHDLFINLNHADNDDPLSFEDEEFVF